LCELERCRIANRRTPGNYYCQYHHTYKSLARVATYIHKSSGLSQEGCSPPLDIIAAGQRPSCPSAITPPGYHAFRPSRLQALAPSFGPRAYRLSRHEAVTPPGYHAFLPPSRPQASRLSSPLTPVFGPRAFLRPVRLSSALAPVFDPGAFVRPWRLLCA